MEPGDDGFYSELSRLNNELVNLQRSLAKKNAELAEALGRVKTLEGILPVCMYCKKVRNDGNSWEKLENYLLEHTDAVVSHGMCPDCMKAHYPDFSDREDSGHAERPKN